MLCQEVTHTWSYTFNHNNPNHATCLAKRSHSLGLTHLIIAIPNNNQSKQTIKSIRNLLDNWQVYQCRRMLQIYKKRLSPQGLELLNSSE